MPKFRVYKAKDATVHFTGVVEAEHIAEAADFVRELAGRGLTPQ